MTFGSVWTLPSTRLRFLIFASTENETYVDLLFSVLSLPEEGPEPSDPRILMRLRNVSRIAASLRHGLWNDESAAVEAFSLERLSEVVLNFRGMPIYGWKFIDRSEGSWEQWQSRLSLDETLGAHGTQHTIELFQETRGIQHLDLRIWFDDLVIYDMTQNIVSIEDFGAAGKRWWDALYAGDERVQGHGIHPLRKTD